MRPLMEQNYYELLEVAEDAPQPRIDHAYRIARATYQPTSAATYSIFSEEENTAILRRIEEAYAVLADSELRSEYDTHLAREKRKSRRQRRRAESRPAPDTLEQDGQLELGVVSDEIGFAPPPERGSPLTELFHERQHDPGVAARRRLASSAARVRESAALESPTDGVVSSPPAVEPTPQRPRHRPLPSRRDDLDLLDEELIDEVLEPVDGIYDGRVLKRMRLALGIEVEEIASITKINESYVQFIEEDRYESLPAPVYVRGFVKEIARVLSLDPKTVADSYMTRMAERSGRSR